MAKDVITRFKLENNGFNSKIKEAAKTLSDLGKSATAAGKDFAAVTKGSVEAARAFGSIQTSSNNAKDRLKELTGAFNEVAKAYNSLTREQQKSDWAKAMADSLTQLQQRIKDTKTELQGLGTEGGIFSKMGDKLGGAMSVFAGNLMTKATMEVANLGSEMAEMVKQGVEMAKAGEGIRIAFERLGNGQILDGLREATHGTVTDIELMKAAVKFNDFKLPIEELGTMLAFAQQKAKDTGQSVEYMTESIVTGLGRKSLMILDNLGLSATEIKDKMAETGDMTKAVGAIIREQMQKAGDYVETAADRAAQANVDLQNKMEELGRKFLPVQEASNQLWTSMKIGILDILGGPLARLLNGLTEAGRLRNQMNDMAGGNSSSETEKQLNFLRKTSPANRQQRYDKQLGIYTQQENAAWREVNSLKGQRESFRKERLKSGARDDDWTVYADFDKRIAEAERKAKAWQNFRADYIRGAKELIKPVEVDIKTDNAVKGVDSLRVKLAELEAQRKKAIKAGDQDLAKNLTKQITQTKSDIKALDPNALKTTTSHTLTKPEQADAKYVQAQKDYEQSLQQAALEVKAGTINSAEAKKKELQAAETLWKSIGDAREVYDSPKLKEAQANVEAKIVALGPEVDKAIEAQKAVEKASRELEMANKKAADARAKLADAEATGELKKILPAQKAVTEANREVTRKETVLHELQEKTVKVNVEQGSVNLPEIPTDDETIKVNVEQGSVNLPKVPTDDETIKVNVEQGSVNLPKVPTDDETIKVNVEQGNVNLPNIPTDDETIKVNVEQGSVNLPKVPTDDETIKVNVEQGSVNLPKVPTDDETIKVNVEQGNVNLPKVPTDDETIKVNVEQGSVNLPEIPTDDETIKVNAETGDVSLPEIPEEKTIKVNAVPGGVKLPEVKEEVQIPVTLSNLDALKQKMTEEMATTPVGDPLLKNMQEAFSDASAIGTIFSTAVKNGIDTATFDTSGIMQKLLKIEDVSDETIQGLVQTYNDALVKAFGEEGAAKLKIVFDVDDKQIKNLSKTTTEEAQDTQKAWGLAAQSVNNMGNALNAIEDPGAKAAGTVIKAIADIALGFAQASHAADVASSGWGWLAWMAAGTAAMATTISTVHSLTGFAEGGEVKGNTFSGDQIPVAVNAGEVILTRAQQGNLAEQLEDRESISGIGGTPYVTGEQIYLGLNNYLKGAGLGQLVTAQ